MCIAGHLTNMGLTRHFVHDGTNACVQVFPDRYTCGHREGGRYECGNLCTVPSEAELAAYHLGGADAAGVLYRERQAEERIKAAATLPIGQQPRT